MVSGEVSLLEQSPRLSSFELLELEHASPRQCFIILVFQPNVHTYPQMGFVEARYSPQHVPLFLEVATELKNEQREIG